MHLRLAAILFALFAVLGVPPRAMARAACSEKTASGVFAANDHPHARPEPLQVLDRVPETTPRGYEPAPGRPKWPNRDPLADIASIGFNIATAKQAWEMGQMRNVYAFIYNDGANSIDADGRLGPAIPIALGAAAAAYLCVIRHGNLSHELHGYRSDKFRHCWVSCRIAKTCGAAVANLAGITKEVKDSIERVLQDIGGLPPEGRTPWRDSLDDLIANQECIPWESEVFGVIGGWIGAACRQESCEECCARKYN